jgi:hypothetical protein
MKHIKLFEQFNLLSYYQLQFIRDKELRKIIIRRYLINK